MTEITNAEDVRPLPLQDHRCTAVIEVLCEATPEDAWPEAE